MNINGARVRRHVVRLVAADSLRTAVFSRRAYDQPPSGQAQGDCTAKAVTGFGVRSLYIGMLGPVAAIEVKLKDSSGITRRHGACVHAIFVPVAEFRFPGLITNLTMGRHRRSAPPPAINVQAFVKMTAHNLFGRHAKEPYPAKTEHIQ